MRSLFLRRGFTLIELLVVISIIAILSGMVFAGVTIARKQSAKVKTTSLLGSLGAAIISYRTTVGVYPGDKATAPTDGWKDKLDNKLVADAPTWAGDSALLLAEALIATGEPIQNPLVDAWKHPLRYRPSRLYPFQAAPTEATSVDGLEPPGRDSFQLWSPGPDGLDQQSGTPGDDLVQWAK